MFDFFSSILDFLKSGFGGRSKTPIITPSVKTVTPSVTSVTPPATTQNPISQSNTLPKVYILRKSTGVQGTPRLLNIANNAFTCHTLELMWDNNKNDVSCIPAGTYTCTVSYSNHMKKDLYHLADVPKRDHVMIHSGNFGGQKSKGFKSDILGCILLGSAEEKLDGQLAVTGSKPTVAKFMELMKNEPFQIEIINNFEV